MRNPRLFTLTRSWVFNRQILLTVATSLRIELITGQCFLGFKLFAHG